MGKEEKENQEQYSTMVNHNTILLAFEGWIKYIEGFSRGLQTTKTVDASSVMDCIGEIMEYMRTLRTDVLSILQHCEIVLEKQEQLQLENQALHAQVEELEEKLSQKLLGSTKEEGEEQNG